MHNEEISSLQPHVFVSETTRMSVIKFEIEDLTLNVVCLIYFWPVYASTPTLHIHVPPA